MEEYGVDEIEKKIVWRIIEKLKGGGVGVRSIGRGLGEEGGRVEEV